MSTRLRAATRAIVAALVALSTLVAADEASADAPVVYRPPVDAPVVDPFRPPESDFGPGNRGLTYDLAAGTPVAAAADGRVVWAGPVAGELHVTVLHDDGRRTSYSFLDSIEVTRGQLVTAGQVVGRAGTGFHFGAREGETYVDPAALFAAVTVEVRLVPHEEPLPDTPASIAREHRILWDLTHERRRGIFDRLAGGAAWLAGGATWLYDAVSTEVHTLWELTPISTTLDVIDALRRWARQECTPASTLAPPTPSGRTAVLVAGYGSSDRHSAIDDVDLAALGYRPGLDLRFSYQGGRIPDADGVLDPALAVIPTRGYEPSQSMRDLWESGAHLADLIAAAADARPGAPVDVFAHSQGGLVTRVALFELERRGRLDVLGTVVTIGTPHSGADFASVAALISPALAAVVDFLTDLVDPNATSTKQMAEGSAFIRELRDRGVPAGVDFRTVGAREDVIVTADKTDVPGHLHATVDLGLGHAHEQLPGHAKTTRELQLALAGLAPECEGAISAVLDAVVPEAVSWAEDWVGSRLWSPSLN